MSQIKFTTQYKGKHVEVMGGWDVPLRHYHLTIFNLDATEDEDEVIWCNLNALGFPGSLEPYRKLLATMGIEVPASFWEECEKREGNVVKVVTAAA